MKNNTKEMQTAEEQEKLQKLIYITEKQLDENIYLMVTSHSFYSYILSKIKLKTEVNEIPVAAVSIERGRLVRYTNPLGYLTYQRNEQIFIDIHEILHLTSFHHLRRGDRDPGLWNICCDIVINYSIKSKIATLPKDALMHYHFNLPPGLSEEEYYDILVNREEPITIPKELQGSLMDDIINGKNNNGNGNGDNENNTKSEKAPGFENLHPHWEELAQKSEDIQKGIVKDIISQAMLKNPGNVPGEMSKVIEKLFEPQKNWPQYLATFSASLISSKRRYTWSRPSRKFGILKPGSLRTKELNMMVVMDTSGSTNAFSAMFLSEYAGIAKYAKTTLVQCDGEIQSVEVMTEVNPESIELKGFGGTSFVPPFELAQEQVIKRDEEVLFSIDNKPDGIIYLTDGYGVAPDYCDIPTLWVITPGGQIPRTVSGGEVDWANAQFIYLDK